jgi:hypothetical protein
MGGRRQPKNSLISQLYEQNSRMQETRKMKSVVRSFTAHKNVNMRLRLHASVTSQSAQMLSSTSTRSTSAW